MKSRLRSYSEAMTQGVFGRDHGIGGGYLPVRRAAGLGPVDALRYE
jgi:hypothetical protein